jgi:hypothetical protein
MPAPEAQRAAMLASYGSREGVLQALTVLSAQPLPDQLREQVIEDTLAGAPAAKASLDEPRDDRRYQREASRRDNSDHRGHRRSRSGLSMKRRFAKLLPAFFRKGRSACSKASDICRRCKRRTQ